MLTGKYSLFQIFNGSKEFLEGIPFSLKGKNGFRG
jgi:hypothetical protein